MSIYMTFRPLTHWPYDDTRGRRFRPFSAGWQNTMNLLQRELHALRADNAIIGAMFREEDLRLDGMPRSDARTPPHPGIEISFDSPEHGRLVYATDSCTDWQHNVRSIALGLEALRAVDRFGITRKGEQYAGWKQLASGEGMSYAEASALIDHYGGVREAIMATHPDRGGDPDDFRRVQTARGVLTA